ncbi:NtaA/DmoA family FMN-dependent monooxygenase [Rhodococcoides kyotonense]|uniref:FMN-dependent oxidoreductase, nitrilotriacetate monooxygenase family n=1 Tax=Rhodococcoides kyotonense TaxID=398843 RepID=A0A239IXY8_9NOCA|nr:NtaA/DmoA family FMN-dependent monooxygenase [Rhodococcus kyotonensis]SNS98385.1 FMN-dependent oxidoreductase, nitrilotriacetate monooxygenase family [Rhodococcus kyotonensis]
MTRRLILNAVLRGQLGGHTAGWRLSSADVRDVTTLDYWVSLARTLERARFDSLFFADTLAIPEDKDMSLQWPLDPLVLITALGVSTTDIGVIATHSTTFNSPYTTARQLSAIDHLTGGRAGWNVVTSTLGSAAANYGNEPLPDHDLRYRVANDYLDAAKKLWLGWEPDAVVADRVTGELFDENKIRTVDHRGEFFSVRGPLTTTRSPQTVPLIAQAGGSAPGIDLAARHADVVYTRQVDLEESKRYSNAIKSGAVGYGRRAEDVKILPGFVPVVADSTREAQDYVEHLRELNDLSRRVGDLSSALGVALESRDIDRPFPYAELEPSTRLGRTLLEKPGAKTLRQVLHDTYGGMSESSGHRVVAGTVSEIVDDIQKWFDAGALDGVSVHPHVLPDGLDDFVERVVPELQDRGLVQTEYRPGTLRVKLGIPVPGVDTSGFAPAWRVSSPAPVAN